MLRRRRSQVKKLLATLGRNKRLPAPLLTQDSPAAVFRSARQVPGMISESQVVAYYWIAVSQGIVGDVVEVGAWQGRSTVALAGACRDSRNGVVQVIDHFLGNPGTHDWYVVGRQDLSDLRDNFEMNMRTAGVDEYVNLHAEDSASVSLKGPVRLLVIDGEHSYEAVTRDFWHFYDLLQPTAIVIFDDYSPEFPGVVQAVDNIRSRFPNCRFITNGRMAVLQFAA